ncbi:DoxX family protein [Rathayibacter sp. VKM Ac-2754]|uniref:DoxX family protein n=1 Tax=Rathayibacter sp. VKM Ac-2754 TaxID=2609251 RepID=UPI0022869D01|nr:DoxX family protein [Rathayibacter sp. VKM Ac-2754]
MRAPDRRPRVAASLRVAVGAMFAVTGVSHFVGRREQMIAMVPERLAAPELLVSATGVLELAGATAMLSSRLTPWAATGLSALLVATSPANDTLAHSGGPLEWSQTLAPRTALQVAYLAATAGLAASSSRAVRATSAPSLLSPRRTPPSMLVE